MRRDGVLDPFVGAPAPMAAANGRPRQVAVYVVNNGVAERAAGRVMDGLLEEDEGSVVV